jgi:hypothetical protein
MNKAPQIDPNRLRKVVADHRRATAELHNLDERVASSRLELQRAEKADGETSHFGHFAPVDPAAKTKEKPAETRTSVKQRTGLALSQARESHKFLVAERDAAADRAKAAGILAGRCLDYCRQYKLPIPKDCEA